MCANDAGDSIEVDVSPRITIGDCASAVRPRFAGERAGGAQHRQMISDVAT